MTKSRGTLAPRRAWSEFELEVMRKHYPITTAVNLAELFNRSLSSVHGMAAKLGLAKREGFAADIARERMTPDHPARAHQFAKGIVPANKGLRRPGWAPGDMARTQFKPGHRPTEMPLGSHRINADGWLDRKVLMDGPPQHRWKAVHRIVWEAAHGPVPPGYRVVFKGGRTTVLEEITLDRLEMITARELMLRNSIHHLPPELADVARLRGRITRAIRQREEETP